MNPNIKIEQTAFYIQDCLKSWDAFKDNKTGKFVPRRSMINSFGAGGSYANLIIEEYIEKPVIIESKLPMNNEFLIIFSAKTLFSLFQYIKNLKNYLSLNPTIPLSKLAKSLRMINHNLKYRVAILAISLQELINKLEFLLENKSTHKESNIYINASTKEDYPPEPISNNLILDTENIIKLALCWVSGVYIDFNKLYQDDREMSLHLPKYAFDHSNVFNFNIVDGIDNENDSYYQDIIKQIVNGDMSEEQFIELVTI